jgi:LytS/YehU family sensor histidine kinase
LQPLIENAVRHGIAPLPEGGEILISGFVHHSTLTLRMLNDCPALAKVVDAENGRRGLGIANTRSRLETFYGENQWMEIGHGMPGKFEVIISMAAVDTFQHRGLFSKDSVQRRFEPSLSTTSRLRAVVSRFCSLRSRVFQ